MGEKVLGQLYEVSIFEKSYIRTCSFLESHLGESLLTHRPIADSHIDVEITRVLKWKIR